MTRAAAITVDSNSGALVTGWTQSPDFPVLPNPNSIQTSLNGPQDAFVARLNTAAVSGQSTSGSWANYFGGSGTDSGTSITLDVNQDTYIAGDTNSTDLHVAKPLQATNNGGYDAFVTQLGNGRESFDQWHADAGYKPDFHQRREPGHVYLHHHQQRSGSGYEHHRYRFPEPASYGCAVDFCLGQHQFGYLRRSHDECIVSCSLPSLQSGSTATVTIVVTPTPNI